MIDHKVVEKFGKALSEQDSARQYPKNPGGVQGAVVREGKVTASPGNGTVVVSIGGGSPVPIRYLGAAPAVAAKVLVLIFGQMVYCLGTASL